MHIQNQAAHGQGRKCEWMEKQSSFNILVCRCYLCLQTGKLKLIRTELLAKKTQEKTTVGLEKDFGSAVSKSSSMKQQFLPLINNSLLRIWKQLSNKHSTIKHVSLASFLAMKDVI